MKAIKFYAIVSLFFLITGSTFGQVPVWTATYPSVSNISALNAVLNVNLTNLPGNVTVYFTVYTIIAGDTPAGVKASSSLPPSGAFRGGGSFTYTAGNSGTTISQFFENLIPSKANNTILVTIEYAPNVFLPVKSVVFATPACANLNVATSRFAPVECVMKGITFLLDIPGVNLNPQISGVYKGTTWNIDWGDGTADMNYTSIANGDFPSNALRTHPYSAITNCVYTVTLNIFSPALCSKSFTVSYQVFVHGKDVPTDGDGALMIEDDAVPHATTTIPVCEGSSHLITLRDISTWNCQNPVLGGLPFPPAINNSPRTIQWLYGIDNGGTLQNTIGLTLGITPNVVIGGANNAIRTIQGYTQPIITPATYQGELSQTIAIPATCRAGEYFDVYLRNWNKCNPYPGDPPVFTSIRILVVATPLAPTPNNQTICVGSAVPALSVNGAPGVTAFYWYSDALLTTPAPGSNNTNIYNTGISNLLPSITTFYVTQLVGGVNTCISPATPVVLTINQLPNKPIIGITGSIEFCFNPGVNSVTLTANTATPPTILSYQWYKGGAPVAGATNISITLGSAASQSGIYTVRAFGANPTNCSGPLSDPVTILIHDLASFTLPTPVTVCENVNAVFTTSTTEPSVSYRWFESTDLGISFNPVGGGPQYSGWLTNTLTILSTPYLYNNYQYKAEIRTPPAQGNCPFESPPVILTVLPAPTANAGAALPDICQGGTSNALGGSVGGSATGGTWSTPAGGTFTPAATNLNATWTPPGAYSGTATLTLTTSGGTCGTATASKTIVVNPNPTVNAGGAMAAICQGGTSAALGGSFGGGATSAVWTDGGAGGSFANNGGATPNTATYTAAVGSGTPVTLRLTTAGGSCGTTFATKNITVNPVATANAGGAVAAICQGATTAALGGSYGGSATSAVWSDGGAGGSFTNNGGLTPNTTTYTAAAAAPASVTLTLTIAGGSCGTTSANKILTVNPNPTVNVGGAMAAICQGGTSAALGGSFGGGATSAVWTDGGAGGSFTNNGGATPNTATYTAAAGSGTPITLRLTTAGGSCGTIFATKNITVNPNPTVNVGGAIAAICQGGTTAALGGSFGGGATSAVWSDGGAGGSFTNNGGATPNTTTYTAAAGAPALVTLTLTTGGGSCGTTFATKIVTVNPLPIPVVSGPLGPCLGSTVAYSTPLVAGHTYLWSVNNGTISGSTLGNTVNILWNGAIGAGWVRVAETITATGCVVTTANYVINVNPGAPGSAGGMLGSNNVCYGATGVSYSIGAVANASNYVWTVPAGVTITSGQGTISILVDFTPGTGSPKLISVYPENGCGAGGTTTLVASIYAQFTSGTIGTAQTICYNTAPAALTELTAAAGGSVSYTYRWQDSPDNITFTNIVAGATGVGYSPPALTANKYYRRNVTDLFCGMVSSPSILITVNPILTAAISGGTTPICYNTVPGTFTATGGGGTGAYTYLWYKDGLTTGVTTQTYAPGNLTATSTFYCAITSGTCGTVNTGTTTITVYGNLTAAISGGSTPICYNTAPGTFTATGGGGTGAYTYLWYKDGLTTGVTTQTYAPGNLTATSTFYCAITSGTCGTVNTGTTTITVYGNLTAAISGGTTPICYNTSPGLFTATGGGGTGAYTYQWYTTLGIIAGATGSTYNPGNITTTTGYYCAITSGTCGTVNTATTTITVYGNLTAAISGGTTPICFNTSPGLFTATGGGGTGAYTYQWYTTLGIIVGATGSTYNPGNITTTTGYYCAITSGTCGTVNTSTTTITVRPTPTATISGTATVCQSAASPNVTFTNPQTLPVTIIYKINGGADNTVLVGASASVNVAAPTGIAGSFIYSLVSIDYQAAPACTNAITGTATITVRPTPTATISGTTSVCQSGTSPDITFTNPQTLPVTVTYKINGGADNTVAVGAGTTATVAAPTGIAGTSIYSLVSVVYQTLPACTNAVAGTATVTVRPTPTATISGTATICQSAASPNIVFTNPQIFPVTIIYKINGGADNTIAVGASTTATVAVPTGTAGTFIYSMVSIDYQAAPTCTNAIAGTATVTIRPTPTATISGTATVCQSGPSPNITFTNPQTLPVTITYKINGGADNTVAVGAGTTATVAVPTGTSGTFIYSLVSVIYQSLPACTNAIAGTATVTVTTSVGTPVFVIGATSSRCQSAGLVTYTANATFTSGITYSLDVTSLAGGNSINASTGEVTYLGSWSGTSIITASAGGCNGPVTAIHTVTVVPLPVTPAISGGGKTAMCRATNGQFYSVPLNAGNTYTWSILPATPIALGGNATDNFIVLNFPNPGVYTLSVREFTPAPLGCAGPLQTLTITVYDNPVVDAGAARTVCAGVPTTLGAVLPGVTASGGSGTFTYLWTPSFGLDDASSPNPVATTNATRTYTLNVNDIISGCATVIRSVVVTVNPLPTIYNVTGPVFYCFGTSGITLNLSGSQAGVDYQLYRNAVSAGPLQLRSGTGLGLNWPNLTTGTYTVRATNAITLCANDMNGSVTVAENPVITITSVTAADPGCSTSGDGVIQINASGGTGALLYSIDNGFTFQSSSTFTNLPGAIYPIVVKDINGCTATTSRTLTSPPALVGSISLQTNVSCFGGFDGSVTLLASGGTGPYTYNVDGGAFSGSALFTGLTAGPHTFMVRDNNLCFVFVNTTITQPTVLTVTATHVNVLCFGNATGTATATPAGGTAPYTYSWNTIPVQTNPTATGLAAGGYTVTITDNRGCTATANVTITQPAAALTTATTQVNVLCNGNSTGTATAIPSGGTAPYTYSWNTLPVQTTSTATGLAAGPYIVTVTDNNGCSTTANVTITQPALALTATTTQVNVLCFGNATGTATAIPAGGTGPYTYSWNTIPGQTAATAINLAAGPYTVTVRDANNCITTANVNITQPAAALSVTTTHVNVLCNGNTTGSATALPAGGTAPYTYSWNTVPVQTTATATGLAAGIYNVTVTDNNGCSANTNVTVTQPTVLTVATSHVNVLCNGDATGTATATPSGGSGLYTYSWNTIPVQTTATATGLIAGAYTVTVTDNNGCIAPANVTITQPAALTVTTTQINVLCFGNATGSATAAPAGGTAPYTYSWNTVPVQTAATASNLTAASYTVTVRDANNCITTAIVNITQPAAAVTVTTTHVNVLCNGNTTGSATATPAGGVAPYTYSWNTIPVQTTATATGLAAGSYSVTATDNNGCIATANVTITQPAAMTVSTSQTNVNCFGNSTGTATATPAGGAAPYTYSWNMVPVQTTAIATGLAANNYTVTVTDNNGCISTAGVAITQPAAPLSVTTTQVNVLCFGNSTGSATATPAGGTAPYSYSWNTVPVQTTATAINLSAIGYTVTITDSKGCISTANVTITQPAAPLTVTTTQVNVLCSGGSTGSATATPAGGTGPYTYAWNTIPVQTTATATTLTAGNHIVTVTDANNCITTAIVTITQPAAPVTITMSQINVDCSGNSTGTATATPAGGTGPYIYAWYSDVALTIPIGQTTATATGLAAGNYWVKVTDASLCTLSASVTLTQPAAVAITAAVTSNHNGSQISCPASTDGIITVSGIGGTTPYQYNLNGGAYQAGTTFGGQGAGTYLMGIRDSHGCTSTVNVTITAPLLITASSTVTSNYFGSQLSCNTSTDGRINVTAAGGTGAYSYTSVQIPGNITGAVTGVFTALPAGPAFTFTVTDINGCSVTTLPVSIVAPPALTLAVNVISNFNGRDISCFGASDGRAEAVVTGGTGSYSYNWYSDAAMTISIGQVTSVALNLQVGTFYVRVRDANNCTITSSVTLTQPVTLDASITAQTNVVCAGNNTGSVTVTANPATGTAPYQYSIDGGGTWFASGTFVTLTASIYTVTARDANGCQRQVPVTISQLGPLNGTVSKTDVSCSGFNDGTITISSPSGGSGNYQYSADGGSSWVGSGNFVNLVPAIYDVRISDANNPGCTATLNPGVIITQPVQLALTTTGDIVLGCFGNSDGAGSFFASGGTMPYNFHLVDLTTTGATLAAAGFNSQSFFNAGAGSITFAVTDFHGCFAQATINVTQPGLLTPGTIGSNQIICAGINPAQLTQTVPASGGPGAYNYQWQYGSTAAGPFFNIAGATGTLYTPPAGAISTLYYRRMITSGLCLPVYCNVVEVLVNPRPVAVLTGGETICPLQTSILNVNKMVGTGPFEIDIENYPGVTITGYMSGANIVVSPAVTTTYRLLRVRDANGCQVLSPSANLIGSATVTVRALPVISTSPVNRTICEYGLATFNVAATGSDLTYQWFVDSGSGFNAIADGGVYFGATNSTLSLFGATRLMNGYIYHVVVTGCASSVTSGDATLTVNQAPEISVQPKDTTACLNSGAAFTITATGTGVTYRWQVNTGSGFNNVIDNANFSGSNLNTLTITNAQAAFNNYIFRIIVSGSCGIPVYSNFAVLRVSIPPTITLNPVNKSTCEGTGPIVFSANGSGLIDSLRWEVFSGGAWSDVHDNAIYSGATSQQLTLVSIPLALNGNQYRLALKTKCITVNTGSGTLTVNSNPVVNFSTIDPIHACGSVPLVINGNPTGGSGTWSSHLWTGDVGPLNNYFIQSPTFTSQLAATFALNYRVKDSNGCFGNGDVTVIVDAPDATFNQDKSNGCTPATVTFTKDMTGIAKFWWDFGDGSPIDSLNANPVHIFTNTNPSSIEYRNVKLTVRSPGGCMDSYTSSVTVYPTIDATFTATPTIICSGNQIVFTTLPGASKYVWDFGDGVSGSFANTTSHLYTNLTAAPVVHTVTLTTTSFYNCTDVRTLDITVMPTPLPQFTALPVSQIYNAAGNPVTFTNTTNTGTWTWLWKFGDGSTSTDQNPVHTYTTLGAFNVVLRVNNANCSDSVKHSVTISPIPPVANFDLIPSGCSPLEMIINNTSLNTNTPGTTYMWDFGDGGASTSKNPSYVYTTPGIFRVELVVTGPGGTSNYSQVVNSYPSPKANFELAPPVVFANDEKVRMFNLTPGENSYLWEFGDGDTSKVKDPYHKYMEEGVYDVTLWAYIHNVINGETVTCSDKYVLARGVTVEPAGVIRFSTVFTPNQSGPIEMDHLPTGGIEIDQFFYPPIREKVTNYTLQVFNRLGVLIFESHDINIPWNGYYHGKLCTQGVYVWYVEGKYANGRPFKKVGDVTLLH